MVVPYENCIVMVGSFPPPIHGMSTTNAAVRDRLLDLGATVLVVDTAAPTLDRSLMKRLRRLPRVLSGLVRLSRLESSSGKSFYLSVSGGLGQIYDIVYVLFARLRGMRIFIRHCSFAYLATQRKLTRILIKNAGPNALHITQCQGMADRLKSLYGAKRVVAISNAVLYPQPKLSVCQRQKVKTLGYLSNLSAEKGIFEFLDLMTEAKKAGLQVWAKLAGPFQDAETERQVAKRLRKLTTVQYLGPLYGDEKDRFFQCIDIFIFPTMYKNETEAKVNHEAMSRGIPVIAYGRGCIPEIVDSNCGLVVDPAEPFVPTALAQIEAWLAEPSNFKVASKGAHERFEKTYAENKARFYDLLVELTGSATPSPHTCRTERFS